jgi:aryl-alcohol dehydrogenase-like predicted oxidoreductase
MTNEVKRVTLGRSGLQVGPLGVAGGYGVEAAPLEAAFEQGVNYFYHGSMRRDGMAQAIRNIVAKGQRDQLVLLLQSYSRWGWLMEVLLLGWYNSAPPPGVLECAERLKEKGLVKHLAISAHHRPSFLDYAADPRYDILHIRYNAAHPGAEQDVFPQLPASNRPGIVAYTATSWGKLLQAGRMPPGEQPLRGRDCYRFVLSNPDFNVSLCGPRNAEELQEALAALSEGPLTPEEQERFRRIGKHVHG